MKFELSKRTSTPLYQQLAGQIQAAIEAGRYQEGDRLPTESELYQQLGVSKGTIKAAYDQLQQMGFITKVQGSGAYVRRPAGEELKERAAQVTRQLFHELEMLPGLSVTQSYALFQEELSRTFSKKMDVCVALVDCSPEILGLTAGSLARIPHLTVIPYLLDDILAGRSQIGAECDFVLTTQTHYSDLLKVTAARKLRLEEMGLSASSETVAEIAKIPPGNTIGILYRHMRFGGNIRATLASLEKDNPVVACPEHEAAETFAPMDLARLCLIVSPDHPLVMGQAALGLLEQVRAAGGQVVLFQYLIDQGSLLHLEQKVAGFYEQKNHLAPEAGAGA